MAEEQVISVECYGILSDYCIEKNGTLILPFIAGMSVKEIRVLATNAIRRGGDLVSLTLLEQSAFATQSNVLSEYARLEQPEPLSWLPPVCGG